MPRNLQIGNGTVLVNFDDNYNLRDLYFPYVGLENQNPANPVRFGIWADGIMKWIWDGWKIDMKYLTDTLVTDVRCFHPELQLELTCCDCVDFHIWVLLRQFIVKDLAGRNRDVRLFFGHEFDIKESDVGNTAYYDPGTSGVVHYKLDRYFLINLCTTNRCGVDHFATGIHDWNGYQGTWRDAEDGQLSGNAIAQGSADSCIGINLIVPANGTNKCTYWVACQKDYEGAARINNVVNQKTPDVLINRTINYWKLWANKEEWNFEPLPNKVTELFKRSLLILRTQVDNNGAIIASADYDAINFARDTYSYMWPRDGALCSYSLIKAGYADLSRHFFNFCLDVISPEGYFLHKFNPDKTIASSWEPRWRDNHESTPIQEDETALVIWALWYHFDKFREIEFIKPLYRRLITNAADFMVEFTDRNTHLPKPSYDLWEERFGVHLFTVATVIGGLRAAAKFARAFGEIADANRYEQAAELMCQGLNKYMWHEKENRFCRMASPIDGGYELDMTVDSALYSIWAFGCMDPEHPRVQATMEAIRDKLRVQTDIGGIARYYNDNYIRAVPFSDKVPGNPWIIPTLWLAHYDVVRAKNVEELEKVIDIFNWVTERALPSGVLAEQIHPHTGAYLSVSPLSWSHATFISVVIDYLEKWFRLSGKPDEIYTRGQGRPCLTVPHVWED